ncbi:tetratricopeptide repeat protein [Paraglaciecola chathamensis]|nr:hypothetical protein [Paraglaciecola agarilytica]
MDEEVIELIDIARQHYHDSNNELAKITAEKAVELGPEEPNAWWFLTLAQYELEDFPSAATSAQTLLSLTPDFANGWAKYALILQHLYDDELDEDAIDAYEQAFRCDPSHLSTIFTLERLYRKLDDKAKSEEEIKVLQTIKKMEGLTPHQLNRLGILHYQNKNYFQAINAWEQNLNSPDGASLYNLGLAFNNPEVSQDVDAIDIWRIAIERNVMVDRSKENIEKLLPRLLDLAENAKNECETVLEKELYYDVYLNPFLLLNYSGFVDVEGEFDFKKAQKLRKHLLQEISLEDGKVYWLGDIEISKSAAIGLCDELYDEKKRYYHSLVFNNKPLLDFLSTGNHKHFCVDQNNSPTELIKVLDEQDSGVKTWLSKYFSSQFDRVLSRAIKKKSCAIVEVLLDGRRWVTVEDSEHCFKSAIRELELLAEELDGLVDKSKSQKVSYEDVEKYLKHNGLLSLLNLMPSFFWEQQDHVVSNIRDIAISTFNLHGDAELSKKIIEMTHFFDFKSGMFKQKIEQDIDAINEIIEEKKKDEVHLEFGSGSKFSITESEIKRDSKRIATKDLVSLRWGGLNTRTTTGIETNSLFVFKSNDGEVITVNYSFQHNSARAERDKKLVDDLNNALFAYLLPVVMSNISSQLEKGASIKIGHITLTPKGIKFESGWFVFSKTNFIPWSDYEVKADNGEVIVFSKRGGAKTSLVLRDIDNAFMLLLIGKDRT